MIYKMSNSVAANTTENTAEETRLKITTGVIMEWDIGGFDEGANLLHLKIFHGGQQLVPFNREADIWPSLMKRPFTEYFPVSAEPFELVFQAWNEDDSYPHEYWVHVTILPPIIAALVSVGRGIAARFRKFLGGE
jgi:hypothetical protein